MSVEVSPSQLGFQRPLTQLVKRILTVTNPNPQPIAFKVKTTAPKQYCVRPNSGRIEPGERVDVSVLLQPMKEDPEPGAKCRDKFLVQSIIITPERESTAFPELWSLIEKESKGSIAEHKIRCVYLSANSEDGQQSPNSASHKFNPNHTSPPVNNHTNRDEDDDPRYNSVRSHPASGFIRPQVSPPDQPTNDNPESTVYDIAMDETFDGRANRPSTTGPSLAALKARNSTHSQLSSNAGNEMANHRPASSILSTSGTKGQASSVNSSSTDDIHKVKSQLAAALAEVERLKASAASSRDQGLRKRTPNSSATDSQRVHSADMLALNTHGLKGPEGLVPVQTVVMISIGVFAFTWLFF
ncbi:phosphatidylinositol-binding protein scs2 [Puccinia graminis f. sp. tritici]|uniref:Phosphatidylinositol-binding protein scs2 n=1 Tax=Puccinia graminis f. sp. tritici TaxID=56615 RepID=A0A5B0N8I8_PUCGR|nr:phosphatidylinositol-binding protein scs2 [Puccinia graminis f. sp. tritici]